MRKGHHLNLDYIAYCSKLREWNNEFKIAFSILSLIFVVVADNIDISIMTILFMGFITVVLGKVHADDYLRLLKIPLFFILLSGAAIAFQIGGNPDNAIVLPGGIRALISIRDINLMFTREGFDTACKVSLRAFGAISAMYLMILSTPIGDILAVLKRVHVPFVIIDLMHLIYRYIFLLTDIWHMQRDAAKSRMGYHNYKSSLRSFALGLSNLLVISIKKSNVCFDAMEARGYDGSIRMLDERHEFNWKQGLIAGLYIGLCCLIIMKGMAL